jgi:hypothetical protein
MAVTLYTTDPRIINSVTSWASPVKVKLGRVVQGSLPRKADVVVTMGQLNGETELFAMRLGAMCIVLPEGGDWMGERIQEGRFETLVGSDLARPITRV